ncbi:MAG: purine-binding chemotaxis protein CheW [Planctomycetaceae bacterium]|nr:purine-binding chemotaxis protein CheW [Planctomycetaceae bacterium]
MATDFQEHIQEQAGSESIGSMQLVSFHLGDETFGVEITRVREIILMCDITHVPQSPPYVKGLFNLRSTVIPVVDLRSLFGLAETNSDSESRIMVMQVGSRTIGIIVDGVDEVLRISKNDIAPPPPTVAGLKHDYLTGLVRQESGLLILLDIERVLDGDTRTGLEVVANDL